MSAGPALSGPAPAPPLVRSGPADAWRTRPYAQVLRGPRHRWWRPLLSVAVVVGASVAAIMLSMVHVALVAAALALALGLDVGAAVELAFGAGASEGLGPVELGGMNLMIATGIPLAALGVVVAHRWPVGFVTSVVGRVRWALLGRAALVSAVVLVPVVAGSVVVDALVAGELASLAELDPEPQWALLALVVLLTTPLQAAGEEYVFRGWLTQTLGSLFARRAVALVVTTAVSAGLFALAHGTQDVWLFTDRLLFGVVASVLVWRTGGLEVAVAVHTVNNVVVFALAIAYGGVADSLEVTTARPVDVAVSVGGLLVVAAVVLVRERRRGLEREVAPGSPGPGDPGVGARVARAVPGCAA